YGKHHMSYMYRPDENLPEVVPDSSPQAIPKDAAPLYEDLLSERYPKYPVVYDDAPKIAVGHEAVEHEVAGHGAIGPQAKSPADLPPAEKGIWGLKKKTFWIIAIAVLVILAAALGGGLGGGLAARNSRASAAPETVESPG